MEKGKPCSEISVFDLQQHLWPRPLELHERACTTNTFESWPIVCGNHCKYNSEYYVCAVWCHSICPIVSRVSRCFIRYVVLLTTEHFCHVVNIYRMHFAGVCLAAVGQRSSVHHSSKTGCFFFLLRFGEYCPRVRSSGGSIAFIR